MPHETLVGVRQEPANGGSSAQKLESERFALDIPDDDSNVDSLVTHDVRYVPDHYVLVPMRHYSPRALGMPPRALRRLWAPAQRDTFSERTSHLRQAILPALGRRCGMRADS